MRDQTRADERAIREAINAAWDRFVVQPGVPRAERKPWTELDLAQGALEHLRAHGFRVSQWSVSQVLGVLVSDGFFLQKVSDALYWLYGDVTLASGGEAVLDALDEVEVGNVVNRAFGAE